MTLAEVWWRALRMRHVTAVVIGIVAVAGLNLLTGSATIASGLGPSPAFVPMSLLAQALVVAVIVIGGTSAALTLDQLASVPTWRFQLTVDLTAFLLAAFLIYATTTVNGPSEWSRSNGVKNLIGLGGLSFALMPRVRREYACVPAIGLVLLATTVGRPDSLISLLWWWLIAPVTAGSGWPEAILLGLIGLAIRVRFRV